MLQFASDEFAAWLLKLAGIGAEVKGGKDLWRARAATNVPAAGREELRNAIAEIIKKAAENGLVKSPITCKHRLFPAALATCLVLINATAVPISTTPFIYTTLLMITDSPTFAPLLTSSGKEKPWRILPRMG